MRNNRTALLLIALCLALASTALASNTWYVDGVNGNDGNDCMSAQTACQTIGHAISLARPNDTITVAPAIYTENLTIGISLNVIGSGAATTIVDGGGKGSVFTIFTLKTVHVRLSALTARNGYTGNGGGILIYGDGGTSVMINDSTISGNSGHAGGGIYIDAGILTINKSTIAGNSAEYGGGVEIVSVATATINNSTVARNSTTRYAAGILVGSVLTINNSTITGNTAAVQPGGIDNEFGTVALQNSIVANNSGGDCSSTITSNGYNLSSDDTCNLSGPGDMNNTDPMLGTLGYHGGPTQTIPLLDGSPGIDAGNPNGCTDGNGNLLKTDQRGAPRPDPEDSGGCDIGAFERQRN
jgi:hypothetical protein